MRGQTFKIKSPTVALERPGDDTKVLHIPAGSAVKVVGEPTGENRLVHVEWNGRTVLMFARDLVERGEPISSEQAG